MSEMSETVTEVLRLDAQATPGPWDEDGIYMGLRHLGKHCSDWYYRDSDGNLIEVPRERDAALIAYYRTAAPAIRARMTAGSVSGPETHKTTPAPHGRN